MIAKWVSHNCQLEGSQQTASGEAIREADSRTEHLWRMPPSQVSLSSARCLPNDTFEPASQAIVQPTRPNIEL